MGSDPTLGDSASHIIFFDGVCNLCNGFVNFIIDRDTKGLFKFSSLQSDSARELLAPYPEIITGENPESVVLLTGDGRVLSESDAVLEIAGLMGGAWPTLKVFKVFPRGFRNAVYRWVARNRYRWFGKRDVCRLPTPELKERFI
ncbi:thiol-disulfide oxidoreductase DCC family protein [Fulvivirga sedimenti]|uniref:Thiol-disulfide oxidoreductase DCC family protein n=1 Tax=Fulvivirga sedimenti TaxID=2879465 RepID=A0A9X1HL00_9BACT|nr:thiol-disulfide oxidoreductase DCC family protein [Fulvivirga sedimenti]MCA6073821.1 thiol-disulfide oxidoreductase DCC family protein [Fulvivirga sedimenti]